MFTRTFCSQSVAPSRVGSRMQQYEDAANEEDGGNTADGAANDPGDLEDNSPPTPRHDKGPNSLSAPLAIAGNGAHHSNDDSDEDDVEEEADPPNPINGGYWRQAAASRPQTPTMIDNTSDVSSMMPPARPKSRVDMATSRYHNLSYWKARRVLFYKNGDPFFPGVEFRFKPGRDIVSLESLLDKLSLRMDLPRGARYVFSMDGDRKYRLDELEDGASYVVSSYKTFKEVPPFIGDIEEMFRKGQAGGVVVGKEKVWSLAYADDLVVLARGEKGMKEMLGNMEKYMRRKKLTVNVEKSKMMVFRKGGGRRKINEWKWEKNKIEEVKEFKYLGYVMNERNTAAAHVRELVKKANKIIGAVWGIGERKFGHDFRRRIMMFDSLVKSVMMYGAEIWGWREQEGLEGVQGKYLKWVLGVDRETPGYIVMEETKRDGIRIEAGKRAIRFEERLIERGEGRILQECLKEKRKEIGKGVWKEREAYFERNGYAGAEIERMREGGRAMTDELVQRDRDVQVQERRTRIRESRYNGKYEKIITEELPKYLGRESRKERVIIAGFRCGNEERENKYWNEDRVCRMCGEKKETIEHMLNECVELREREESREEMLNEDGRGIEWMKKVEWRRGTICGEG
ncbi:hypothetical protein GEV33_006230 [Tenebrio molitor]|uniref:Doublecortin domain-containing protein n=1 Tax=Tenebrio molitor TaxID=7067 RepID=A0A8J6LKD8_TENMO|nr:hypothetical protein GEV33_006230 [Tenebrio molitor]